MDNQELYHVSVGEAYMTNLLHDNSDELYHYGRKGMKWGQHIFGKVKTGAKKAGKKTVELAKAGYKKASTAAKFHAAETRAKKAADRLRKKPIKDLTDEELAARTNRMIKEKELRILEKSVNELSDAQKTAGRKFAESMVTKVAIPAVLNAGEKQLTAFLNKKLGDAFGLGEKDSTVIKDLLEGRRDFKDLTDKEFNTVGKAGESVGNFVKTPLGKIMGMRNQTDDDGPNTTYFRDILSGKAKMSDFDDKTVRDIGKTAEAADNTQKVVDKFGTKGASQSEAKPKTEPKSEPKDQPESSKSKPKDDTDMDRILNSNIDDLSNEDLATADKWLKSLGL